MANNPYKEQTKHAFWRPAIAERHWADLENLSNDFDYDEDDSNQE